MPAKDKYHDAVKNALIKDGWVITHDPLTLPFGLKDVYVDLGAERMLAAERGMEKIAIEIKTFLGRSDVADLQQAVGQYVMYRAVLSRTQPERRLYLAVPQMTADTLLLDALALVTMEDEKISYVVYNAQKEIIVRWQS